ncbi:MAG: hypothetical protein JSV12_05395 [Candidatus Bathyarchaeota archaeon]|nr:MAG: hypothetical protein JSV12_05395 [Candidatus Bathyarchaeota archaeon]
MSTCKQCGRDVSLPFGCCYCRKAFCSDHVRPENHLCAKLKYWRQTKEAVEGTILKSRKLAFCIILILLGATVALASSQSGSRELRDPIYQEVIQFIESDQTDRNLYKEEEYVCSNFAKDFQDNAFKAGYRCGYVLAFTHDLAHALNCFNTTDHGLIFVEPQEDEIVKPTIGEPYWNRTKYRAPSYNDTVTSFLVTW